MIKRHLLAASAAFGVFALLPSAASAIECVAGVYRAGCVGPSGAVVVKKPPVYHPPAKVTCASGVYNAGCVGPNGAVVVKKPRCTTRRRRSPA